jgi:hypothetical protein
LALALAFRLSLMTVGGINGRGYIIARPAG